MFEPTYDPESASDPGAAPGGVARVGVWRRLRQRRRKRRGQAPKARVELNAVGARIEAPRGGVMKGGVPFPIWGGV